MAGKRTNDAVENYSNPKRKKKKTPLGSTLRCFFRFRYILKGSLRKSIQTTSWPLPLEFVRPNSKSRSQSWLAVVLQTLVALEKPPPVFVVQCCGCTRWWHNIKTIMLYSLYKPVLKHLICIFYMAMQHGAIQAGLELSWWSEKNEDVQNPVPVDAYPMNPWNTMQEFCPSTVWLYDSLERRGLEY